MPTTDTLADLDRELLKTLKLLRWAEHNCNITDATAHWTRIDHLLEMRLALPGQREG